MKKISLIFLAIIISSYGIAHSQIAKKKIPIYVGITSKTLGYITFWVAQKKGFFDEQNLKAEIVVLRSSTRGIQALVGRSTEFSGNAADSVLAAVEKGANIVMIGGNLNGVTYTIVGGKKYKKLQDIKGTTLGVSGIASGSTIVLREILKANNLHYPRDYQMMEAGGTPERFVALESGRFSTVILAAPLSFIAIDRGFNNLAEAFDYVKDYQHTSLSIRIDWGMDNRDIVLRFLKSMVRTYQWVHKNKEEAVVFISKELDMKPNYAELGWRYYAENNIWPKNGELNMKGIETQIKILAEMTNMKPPLPKPEKYVDLSYLDEVNRELSLK